MKKIAILAILAMVVASGYADITLRTYTHAGSAIANNGLLDGLPGAPLSGDLGLEAGGTYTILDLTADPLGNLGIAGDADAAAVNFGWYDSLGGLYLAPFNFDATELHQVALKVFNAAGTWTITSQSITLADLEPPIAAGATDVSFDFSGQNWVAIPEPGTIGLMGVAGLGMFLARKKARS